jgi:hyperosmotically inducible protein
MKTTLAIICVACGALCGSALATASESSSSDTTEAVAYVKDSTITTKVKAKLAAEHITSIERIHVATDKDGVVWLSGTATTQKAADKALSLARETEGVRDVHSHIRIKSID